MLNELRYIPRLSCILFHLYVLFYLLLCIRATIALRAIVARTTGVKRGTRPLQYLDRGDTITIVPQYLMSTLHIANLQLTETFQFMTF